MKKHSGGITAYLNQTTQKAIEQSVVVNQIIDIDIKLLEANNSNFYGLRDLESLAGMIATSGYINPLEVKQLENGKYKIISGHRRHAAISLLIENGERIDPKIPCIVRDFEPKGPLSADEIERCYLIFSNRGQRQYRTVSEKLEEIRLLEPIAHKIWESERKNGNIEGNFRSYFSEELNMSSSGLQRLLSLNKLLPKLLDAVDNRLITETTAAKLATLTVDEQSRFLLKLEAGELNGTAKDIEQILDRPKETENVPIFSPEQEQEHPSSFQTISSGDDVVPAPELCEKELEEKGQEQLFRKSEPITDEAPIDETQNEKTKDTTQSGIQDILPQFEDADWDSQGSVVLQGLSEMLEKAIKMIAIEKANNNEEAVKQWDKRRANVVLVMGVLNE